MRPELGYLCDPLLLRLLDMCQKLRSVSTHMIVHSMVVQKGSSGFLPGWEQVACLRDDIGIFDGNCLAFALSMLMLLLLPDARNAKAKPLLHDLEMLRPDIRHIQEICVRLRNRRWSRV